MTRRKPWGLYALLAVLVIPVTIAVTHVPAPVWAAVASLISALVTIYLMLSEHVWTVVGVLALALAARLAYGAVRFARLPRQAKHFYLPAVWARFRWRWLAHALELSYLEKHQHAIRPVLAGTAAPMPAVWPARRKLRFPRAKFRATPYGIDARVRAIPQVGREEFDQAAEHVANAWKCVRVSVSQPAPGAILLRGMRRDPLTELVPASVLPPGFDGRRIWLGRDEMGDLRPVSLANISGSVMTGNPGRGKTEAARSLAVQLAPSPLVEFYILDGGGGCDWSEWEPAAVAYCGDDLEAAGDFLLEFHQKMQARRRALRADLGTGNAWSVGPSPAYPLRWLLVEESPFFLDLDAVKGDPKREKLVRACRGLLAAMLRRGRAPLHHTTLIAQKGTGSSGMPPDIRDLCGLRWSFGVSTTEAAVACLGDDVRKYESLSPVLLQGAEHVGVATALIPTGMDPFTRIKFPVIGDDLAARTAVQASRRRAPVAVPDDLADLEVTP